MTRLALLTLAGAAVLGAVAYAVLLDPGEAPAPEAATQASGPREANAPTDAPAPAKTAALAEPVAPPRGPRVGEIVPPPRRNVTPSTLTRYPDVTEPLIRVQGVTPPPRVHKPQPREMVLRRVVVPDGGRLHADDTDIALARIEPLTLDATCTPDAEEPWPCGMAARTALRRLIRGRAVTCTRTQPAPGGTDGAERQAPGAAQTATSAEAETRAETEARPQAEARADERTQADCTVAGQDISDWMIRYGWARPADARDEDGARLLAAAQAAGRGQWRAGGIPAVPSETLPDDGGYDALARKLDLEMPQIVSPAADTGGPEAPPPDTFFDAQRQ